MIAVRLLAEGAVVREAVFSEGSVLLGRGPECEFAIVDGTVSRQHARLRRDLDGTLWLEDAGSRNGVQVGAERVQRVRLPAGGALRCRLGTVELEIAVSSADATLELQAAPSGARRALGALKGLGFCAAGVAAWVCLMLLEPDFWSPWKQERASTLSWVALGMGVGLPVVAFVLMGLLRIVGRRVSASAALRALALVSWGWLAIDLVERAASYVLSVGVHGMLSTFLTSGSLVATMAFLASVGRRGPRRRFLLVWITAIGLLVLGFNGAARLAARQAGAPRVDYAVSVPLAGVSGPATDLDEYIEGVHADFSVAERHAAEERRLQTPR
jgi:hypothetical protein